MLSDALAKFGRGIRSLGASAETVGKDIRAVCDDLEGVLVDLRGGAAPKDPPRRRERRPRPVPPPSSRRLVLGSRCALVGSLPGGCDVAQGAGCPRRIG